MSKVVTFATIFGSEGCSVSDALCVSKEEGFKLVESFFNIFPEIKNFRNNIVKFCKDTGYTKTMLGRPRFLPEIKSSNQYIVAGAERQAFNTAIQATCADLFKISAHKVFKYSNEGVSFKFGVFDSLLLEVPKSMEESYITSIINDLSDFSSIFKDFKFNYDYSIGESWGECCDKM